MQLISTRSLQTFSAGVTGRVIDYKVTDDNGYLKTGVLSINNRALGRER